MHKWLCSPGIEVVVQWAGGRLVIDRGWCWHARPVHGTFIIPLPTHIPLASRSIQLQGYTPIMWKSGHLRNLGITLGPSVWPSLRRFGEELLLHYFVSVLEAYHDET
jgi:hypothetical protein